MSCMGTLSTRMQWQVGVVPDYSPGQSRVLSMLQGDTTDLLKDVSIMPIGHQVRQVRAHRAWLAQSWQVGA